MLNNNEKELVNKAKEASEKAYAEYSGYRVGAALLTQTGKIFTGCNVENASYSLTNCAERTAIFKAVSEGEREFVSMAVYVQSEKLFPPCGACRQVIAEFSDDMTIIYANESKIVKSDIKKLLPESFKLS